MLSQPKPIVPKPLCVLREVAAIRQRLRDISTFNNGREIKNGEWDHVHAYRPSLRPREGEKVAEGRMRGRPSDLSANEKACLVLKHAPSPDCVAITSPPRGAEVTQALERDLVVEVLIEAFARAVADALAA